MKRLVTIKGVLVMAVVVLLTIGATYVAAQGIFDKTVTGAWTVAISGDAIQVYEADGTTVVSAIDFGTSFKDFFGNVPIPTHKVVVKNLSATVVEVVITGDQGDGIIPLFGPVTGDLKPDPDNAFVLQPQGQSGDMTMGYVGLTLRQFTPGSKTTTIIFRAKEAGTQQVVVPNAQTTVEGNTFNRFPFNLTIYNATSMRYQQVYSSGDIGGSGIIDQIAFRPDFSQGQVFAISGDSVEIRLSHTPKTVDGLSATFANNVGADETVVLDTTNLILSSSKTNCGAGGPCDFDIVIDLNDTFTFNGTGNLLLDVRMRTNIGAGNPDAQNTFGDGVSRAFSGTSGSVNDPTGFADSAGLVTKFFLRDWIPSASAMTMSPPEGSAEISELHPEGSQQ